MDKLLVLREIFACIQECKRYQNKLISVLLEVKQKLRWIQICRRKISQNFRPKKPRGKRKRVPYHPAYQLLNLLKTKIKRTDFQSHSTLSSIEKKTLQEIYNYFPKDWNKISLKMQKPILDCLLGYAQNAKEFKKNKQKWTSDEDNQLLEAVQKVGTKNWSEVANYIDGKSGSSCFHRYMKMLNPSIKRGKWEASEDAQLYLSVKLMGTNWVAASKLLKTRTDLQCRERYCNILSTDIDMSEWTLHEDLKLFTLVSIWGKKWSKIAKMFNGRTDNQCWRRSKILVKTWDFVKIITLARILRSNVPKALKEFWVNLQIFKLI